jgi:N-glycosylase/DNA lyase
MNGDGTRIDAYYKPCSERVYQVAVILRFCFESKLVVFNVTNAAYVAKEMYVDDK